MSRDWTYLTWSEKTWSERAWTVVCNILAGIVGLGMFAVVLFVLGSGVERITEYKSDHDRCLKNATNGLEIKQCR